MNRNFRTSLSAVMLAVFDKRKRSASSVKVVALNPAVPEPNKRAAMFVQKAKDLHKNPENSSLYDETVMALGEMLKTIHPYNPMMELREPVTRDYLDDRNERIDTLGFIAGTIASSLKNTNEMPISLNGETVDYIRYMYTKITAKNAKKRNMPYINAF